MSKIILTSPASISHLLRKLNNPENRLEFSFPWFLLYFTLSSSKWFAFILLDHYFDILLISNISVDWSLDLSAFAKELKEKEETKRKARGRIQNNVNLVLCCWKIFRNVFVKSFRTTDDMTLLSCYLLIRYYVIFRLLKTILAIIET